MSTKNAMRLMYENAVSKGWGRAVISEEIDNLDFESGNFPLEHFISYLNSIVAETEPDQRKNLYVEFEIQGDGWQTRPSVYSIRPKTEQELSAEAAAKEAEVEAGKRRERMMYLQLKAKFEP